MSWLLDTNVVSELFRQSSMNRGLRNWFIGKIGFDDQMYLSAITIGELKEGALRLPDASPKRNRLLAWLNADVRLRFQGRILSIDENVGLAWGALRAEWGGDRRVAAEDSLIAATALHHGHVLVTRDVQHMSRFSGLIIENPWI